MLERIIKTALKNIFRNKFLSFSSIVVLGLLMFFVNLLMIMNNLSNTLVDAINSKLSISLYLKDDYASSSDPITQKLISGINDALPEIEVQFKTKEEVLEEMREKDPDLVNILETLNPLPATIVISNIGMEDYELLNSIIEGKYGILADYNQDSKRLYDYRAQYERIQKIISMLGILQFALYIIIGVFLLSIFVITYSIIGNFIYHYRDEIAITKLVGGSNGFIYGPFVVQGVLYSMLGFLLSTGIFYVLVSNVAVIFESNDIYAQGGSSTVESFIMNEYVYKILLIQFGVFALIGVVSAFLSSRKYIK